MFWAKNIGVDWTGERIRKTHGHLSDHSRVSVLGAGEAMRRGLVDRVIFTVTNTAGSDPLSEEDAIASRDFEGAGKPMLSEAEYMRRKFISIFPRFADRAHVQDRSWDTNRDAKEAKKIQNSQLKPTDETMLMSVGFHLDRALYLFKRAKVRLTDQLASDDTLEEVRPRFIREYRTNNEKYHYQDEINKEKKGWIFKIPIVPEILSLKTKRRMIKSKTA